MKALALLLAALAIAAPASARDLLLTVARPGSLYIFDAAERRLERECPLGVDMTPGVIQMSPDGKTAYILVNRWQDVIGIDIATCARVFYAAQSQGDVVRHSIGSLAVSADGREVYTVRNPVRHLADRYQVLDPEFAVYSATGGTDAQPIRTFPAPRRSNIMAAAGNGTVFLAGHDIFAIDPTTGETTVAIPLAHWDRPTYGPPDALAFSAAGAQNNEMLLLYGAPVFADSSQRRYVDYVLGYTSVDLRTGTTEIRDVASYDVALNSAVRDPTAPNLLYGVHTQLSKYDVFLKRPVRRTDLPHTYFEIDISSDGTELYIGGASNDIGIYESEKLERIGEIRIPSGGDMGSASLLVVRSE